MVFGKLGVVITSAGMGERVTVAVPDFVVSALLVAVIVAVLVPVTHGAVNSPVVEIVPWVAFQVTAVFVVPVTVAVNWVNSRETRLAVGGVTVTVIAEVVPSEFDWPSPAVAVQMAKTNINKGIREKAGMLVR
jgi:hypothetical protein